MHAAQRAAVAAQRSVDLYDTGFQAGLGKLALAKKPGEKTALIFTLVEIDQKGAGQRCRSKMHTALTPASSRSGRSPGRDDAAMYAAGRTARRQNRLTRNGVPDISRG